MRTLLKRSRATPKPSTVAATEPDHSLLPNLGAQTIAAAEIVSMTGSDQIVTENEGIEVLIRIESGSGIETINPRPINTAPRTAPTEIVHLITAVHVVTGIESAIEVGTTTEIAAAPADTVVITIPLKLTPKLPCHQPSKTQRHKKTK